MLQRIQSVYLFLGAVAMILFTFLPLYNPLDEGDASRSLWDTLIQSPSTAVIPIVSLLVTVLSLIVIFQYGNLKRQLRNVNILICITVTLVLIVGVNIYNAVTLNGIGSVNLWITALPVSALLMFVLGRRGVKSDKQLLESADRIR